DHRLLVAPDGSLTPLAVPVSPTGSPDNQPPRTDMYGEEVSAQAPQPIATDTAEAPAAESPARPSSLSPTPEPLPRPTGWRGFARRLGIVVKPSAAERRRAEWAAVVSRQWAGCRTIAITNGKGGVGKTMTTAM